MCICIVQYSPTTITHAELHEHISQFVSRVVFFLSTPRLIEFQVRQVVRRAAVACRSLASSPESVRYNKCTDIKILTWAYASEAPRDGSRSKPAVTQLNLAYYSRLVGFCEQIVSATVRRNHPLAEVYVNIHQMHWGFAPNRGCV